VTLAFSSAKTATTAPRIAFAAAIVTLFASGAQAETTIIPSGAQTPEQAGADTTACQTQAASQSGYHPSQPAPTASQPRAGQRLTGAVRGTAAGAVHEERTDQHEREYEDAVELEPKQVPLLVASDTSGSSRSTTGNRARGEGLQSKTGYVPTGIQRLHGDTRLYHGVTASEWPTFWECA
jgi:hypothetical protein